MTNQPPELSQGFFQHLLRKDLPSGFNPVLQVLETRYINSTPKTVKLRLSDGYFSYSYCVLSSSLTSRFAEEGLIDLNAIIQVLASSLRDGNGGRPCFTVDNYVLLTTDFPIIGSPVPHSGKPEDYANLSFGAGFYGSQVKNEIENSPRTPKTPSIPQSLKRGHTDNDEVREPLKKKQNGVPYETNASKLISAGITPLSLITPFMNKWTICGVVSGKESKRSITTAKGGQMNVFSFLVSDASGMSIKISAFGEQADQFDDRIVNDMVYKISSDGHNSVRPANKRYNSTGHDYELVLSRSAEVDLCENVIIEPKFKIKQTPLDKIGVHVNECVDVLAIVHRLDDISQVTQRSTQAQLDKRDIYLLDKTNTEVRFTLWSDEARSFHADLGDVIGVKGASVREFNGGLSLSSTSGTQIRYNPEGQNTQSLYLWYSEEKPTEGQIKTLSGHSDSGSFERDYRIIGVLNQYGVDLTSDKNYFTVRALITSIKMDQAFYQACSGDNCRKKLVEYSGMFRCEKCDKSYVAGDCKQAIMLQMEITDATGIGNAWVTLFDEKAQSLLGVSGAELAQLHANDPNNYEEVFNRIRYRPFIFRVGLRYETYNDQQRLKWRVYDIKKDMPAEKIRRFILQNMSAIGINPNDDE